MDFSCLTYASQTATSDFNNNASATATLSGFSGPIAISRSWIITNDRHIEASGAVPPTCSPGGSKGAGSGPLAAGSYHSFGPGASAAFGSYPGPVVFVAVNDITEESRPEGSPASVKHLVSLNIQMFGGAVNGSGCWIIPPSSFTSTGVTAASLQTTITSTTEACPSPFPFPSTLPLPLDITVAWSGTGPVVTVRRQSAFTCLGYTIEADAMNQFNNASANASLTMPQSTAPFTGGQASIVTGDRRIQVEGVQQQSCLIRG